MLIDFYWIQTELKVFDIHFNTFESEYFYLNLPFEFKY